MRDIKCPICDGIGEYKESGTDYVSFECIKCDFHSLKLKDGLQNMKRRIINEFISEYQVYNENWLSKI